MAGCEGPPEAALSGLEESHDLRSNGRRSSQKLADHLKGVEELGLSRLDYARDAVSTTDPVGLRGRASSPARQLGGRATHRHE